MSGNTRPARALPGQSAWAGQGSVLRRSARLARAPRLARSGGSSSAPRGGCPPRAAADDGGGGGGGGAPPELPAGCNAAAGPARLWLGRAGHCAAAAAVALGVMAGALGGPGGQAAALAGTPPQLELGGAASLYGSGGGGGGGMYGRAAAAGRGPAVPELWLAGGGADAADPAPHFFLPPDPAAPAPALFLPTSGPADPPAATAAAGFTSASPALFTTGPAAPLPSQLHSQPHPHQQQQQQQQEVASGARWSFQQGGGGSGAEAAAGVGAQGLGAGVGSGSGGREAVGGGWSEGAEVASETEDRILEAARQADARLEGVFGALAGGITQLLPAAPEASTAAAHTLIREVWEVVDSNYLDARATGFDRQRWAELRDQALALPYRDTGAGYRAVRDMMARGLSDPYCRFIGPPELDAMKKYDVSGVGLNLGTAAEYVVKTGNELPAWPASRSSPASEGVFVVGVSRGSIADVAGIRQGDQLLAIQGESLAEATPFRASGLISGAADEGGGGGGGGGRAGGAGARAAKEELVVVKVRHGGGGEEDLRLVRPLRVLPTTVSTSLTRSAGGAAGGGGGARAAEEVVGTVRLAAFNARAQADVASAIRRLEAGGATRLVLDLRDNRGGLVTEGLEVAKLFLDGDAPIVITERRDAPPDTPRASGPPLTSAPLLVLVNSHTASASEIVAGALKDNCRAVLAGSRTYGKGLIQSVYELTDGSGLVVTVGKYLTPRGNDIDRFGIQPDFSGVPSPQQYERAIRGCRLADAQLPAPQLAAEAGAGAEGAKAAA